MTERLLIFARCPIPGKVKTRLIPSIGIARTTQLYTRLLENTLEQAQGYGGADRELWLDSAPQAPACRELLRRHRIGVQIQSDGDLGRRMQWALDQALTQSDKAVLIGTDCPDMSAEVLKTAFAALDDADAVFAPAIDGGYVLIGARRTHSLMFDAIPWGSRRVMAETRTRLGQLGWVWQELPPLQDVDEDADLAHPFVQAFLAESL